MAFPLALLLPGIIELGGKLIDDLIETDDEKAAAKVKLMAMVNTGKMQELQLQLSAIMAEAQSTDPWTSRARPTFLYVIYLLILTAIPMGVLYAYDPAMAERIAEGFGKWLNAIPEPLYALFGAGYLGYTAFRSWDKRGPKA